MSREWEFFQCQMENGPASIFLDIGINAELPLKEYNKLLNIRIHLKSPNEDGLSSSSEFQALCDLEDEIELVLKELKVIYAGRITYNKSREYFFYCQDLSCKDSLVKTFLKYDYKFDLSQIEDPEWSGYLNELYPTADDWQVIKDRRVVDNLIKYEDDLQKARKIDHHAYFQDKQNVQYFVEKILELNFELSSVEEEEAGSFKIEFCRVDRPVFPQISSITLPLRRLVQRFDGRYGGWGTYIQSEK